MTERQHFEKDVIIREKGQAPTGAQTLETERSRLATGMPVTSNLQMRGNLGAQNLQSTGLAAGTTNLQGHTHLVGAPLSSGFTSEATRLASVPLTSTMESSQLRGQPIVQTTFETQPKIVTHERAPEVITHTAETIVQRHEEAPVVREVLERPIIKEHHQERIKEHHQEVIKEEHRNVIHEHHRPVIEQHIQPIIHETHITEKHQPIIHEKEKEIIHEKHVPIIHERHEKQFTEQTKAPIVHEMQAQPLVTHEVLQPVVTSEYQQPVIQREEMLRQNVPLTTTTTTSSLKSNIMPASTVQQSVRTGEDLRHERVEEFGEKKSFGEKVKGAFHNLKEKIAGHSDESGYVEEHRTAEGGKVVHTHEEKDIIKNK